jgi:hypothetical protein
MKQRLLEKWFKTDLKLKKLFMALSDQSLERIRDREQLQYSSWDHIVKKIVLKIKKRDRLLIKGGLFHMDREMIRQRLSVLDQLNCIIKYWVRLLDVIINGHEHLIIRSNASA